MSFVELSNVMFRGTLRAANGSARFKLTADAIDAVDTVNINFNQVTYDRHITYSRPSQTAGSTLASLNINVPDDSAWLEIVAYGVRAGAVLVDGIVKPNRNRRSPDQPLLPFVELVQLNKGPHIITMTSNSSGSCSGVILCRYIRNTGG